MEEMQFAIAAAPLNGCPRTQNQINAKQQQQQQEQQQQQPQQQQQQSKCNAISQQLQLATEMRIPSQIATFCPNPSAPSPHHASPHRTERMRLGQPAACCHTDRTSDIGIRRMEQARRSVSVLCAKCQFDTTAESN